VSRQYLAILYGEVTSDVPVVWERDVDGKSAKTTVHVLGTDQGLTAASVRLHTGRKHQIRIHASLADRPIVGDRRYGGDAGRRWNRLALHASRLQLTHPITGDALDLCSPVPDDLTEIWAQAGGITAPLV
jgi:23S rRNA pseudouridine1911/1915/1917 synthase